METTRTGQQSGIICVCRSHDLLVRDPVCNAVAGSPRNGSPGVQGIMAGHGPVVWPEEQIEKGGRRMVHPVSARPGRNSNPSRCRDRAS